MVLNSCRSLRPYGRDAHVVEPGRHPLFADATERFRVLDGADALREPWTLGRVDGRDLVVHDAWDGERDRAVDDAEGDVRFGLEQFDARNPAVRR